MIPFIGEAYVKELYDKRNFNQNKIQQEMGEL